MSLLPEIEAELMRAARRPRHQPRLRRGPALVANAAIVMLALAGVLVAGVLLVVLHGSVGHHRAPAPHPAAPRTPRAPLGSPGNPAALGCGEAAGGISDAGLRPGPRDLNVGPYTILYGRTVARKTPKQWGAPPDGMYKLVTVLARGTSATVTIAPSVRSYALMSNPYFVAPRVPGPVAPPMTNPRGSAVSITYHACRNRPSPYPGAFGFRHGQTRGCIPLDVTIPPSRRVHHVMLALFDRSCGSG